MDYHKLLRMNRFIIFAAVTCGLSLASSLTPAFAVTVEATPGQLSRVVAAATDPATETSLTVTGAINAADFDFLRGMTALRSLDLSGVSITAYSGPAIETGLTSAKANTLPDCALMSGRFTTLTLPAVLTEISDGALGGSDVETLVIPPTVKTISTGAFSGMKRLRSATIPVSVTSLGEMAFSDCPLLETVVINAPVATLPASTFKNCPKLANVTLPATLTAIGDGAFAGCAALTSLSLPTSLATIGEMAFTASGLNEIDLTGGNLTTIGDWAFAGCPSLTTITVGDGLARVGKGAFYNDPSLALNLGDLAANLTEIPDFLLYGASSATTKGFENTPVETVGKHALSGMNDSKVSLPSTLSHLDDNAMERWANLKEIDAADIAAIPSLGESVWEDTPQASTVLYVPNTLFDGFKDAPQWQEFDVKTETASTTEITPEETPAHLRAYFDGLLLMLEAGCDIRAAQLYDVSGRCFTIARNYQGNRLTVDTAPFDARVFIVRLLLSDGTTPVLKLMR